MANDFQTISVVNSSSELPKRRIVVELRHKDGVVYSINKETSQAETEVRVKFSRVLGGLSNATIEIVNLMPEVIAKFATGNYLDSVDNIIRIYAGYEDNTKETTNLPLLYEGYILWSVVIQGRPDVIFKIDAIENYKQFISPLNLSQQEDMSMLGWVSYVIQQAGFTANTDAIDALEDEEKAKYLSAVKSMTYNGNLVGFLRGELKKFCRMQFCQEAGIIYLYPNSDDNNNYLSRVDRQKLIDDNKIISADVNAHPLGVMIGIPTPTYTGVNVRTLFNRTIRPYDLFVLQSITSGMSAFNKAYLVLKVNYSLQLRGQSFYADIEAVRYTQPSKGTEDTTSIQSATVENTVEITDNSAKATAKRVSETAVNNLEVRAPCTVLRYYSLVHTVDLKVAINQLSPIREDGKRTFREYATLLDIPVRTPKVNGLAILTVPEVGDTGWVVASDMDTFAWTNSDKFPEAGINPSLWGGHKWCFGYFEPENIYSKPNTDHYINPITKQGMAIQTTDGKYGIIINKDGNIFIKSKSLTIDGDTTFNDNVNIKKTLTNGEVNMTTHIHKDNHGGNTGQPHN